MTSLNISFGGGNVAIATESTVGTVHTTSIYLMPIWYLLIPVALGMLIWFGMRGRNDSRRETPHS